MGNCIYSNIYCGCGCDYNSINMYLEIKVLYLIIKKEGNR